MKQWIYLIPVITCFWFPVTFIITYTISVCLKDVAPLFPYISDTGTFSPESCIFGQLLNMGSILMSLTIYIRYQHVKEVHKQHPISHAIDKLNKTSLWLGHAAAFGISIVGNFQESNVFSIHMLGAFLSFGLGAIYSSLQTIVSFKIHPYTGKRTKNVIRLALCITCGMSFTICLVSGIVSLNMFKGKQVTKWQYDDGGYHLHLISTVAEWITAIALMGFILSYAQEFRCLEFQHPKIRISEFPTNESKIVAEEVQRTKSAVSRF